MAAIDAQQLMIVINGDARPFKRAMREMKAEATSLKSQLATVNKLIQFNPGSLTLLTRRQQLLNASLAQTATQLRELQRMNSTYASRAAQLTEAERRQWQMVQRQLGEAELRYAQLRAQAIQYGTAASAAHMRVTAAARGVQASLAKISTAFLGISAVTALVGALALKASVEFESSFAGVRKTIIATKAEYEQLARSARDLALVKPVSVNDINRIMELGGQLNIAKQHLTEFTSVMADLSVSTNMGIEDGALDLARFMNIVNMAQADVDRLGATIVDLGNNSATTEADIMLMAMRIAGAGRNIGLSAQNVLALATSLSSVGIQAEMGGNAIATILNRIDKAVALDSDTLATWASVAGMTSEEFKHNWETNVEDTVVRIIKGMGEYREEGNNINVLLKDLNISYMRQIDTMQRLSRSGTLLEQNFIRANTAWSNNTALIRESTQRYSTAESKVKMMGNALYEAGITIGNEILPYFSDLVVGITGAIHAFAQMDSGTKSTIITLGGIATMTGVVIKAIEKVAGGIGFMSEKLAQFKTWVTLTTESGYKFTAMEVAQATSMSKGAAAAQREALAQAAAARVKAASLRAAAQNAAAHGAEAYASRLNAMASGQEAIAQEASTVATSLNSAASVDNAAKKSLLSAVTKILTADNWALAAALGITNGQLLAFIAAGVGIAALGFAIASALDPMNQLTNTSRKMSEEVDAAKAKYEELKTTQGEHAEATIKAKQAYEELDLEFKENSQTLKEYQQDIHNVIQASKELTQEVRDANSEADTSAGKILNLVDDIERLKSATSDEDKLELATAIQALNGEVEGLDLTMYDAINNTAEYSVQLDKAAEAANSIRADNAYEQFGTMRAEVNELNGELEKMRENYSWLNDETAAQMVDPANAANVSANNYAAASQYMQLKDQITERESLMEEEIKLFQDTATKAKAYETALRYAADANVDQADALKFVSEQFGVYVDEAGLAEYQTKKDTEALAETNENIEKMTTDLMGLMGANAGFAQAMVDDGMSLEWLSGYLVNAGVTFEDFKKAIEGATEAGQNLYESLNEDADVSIAKVIENLEANKRYMDDYAKNVETLYNYADQQGNETWKAFLGSLSASSEQDAALVAQLAANPEMLGQVADLWYQAGESSGRAVVAGIGATSDEAQAALDQYRQGIQRSIEQTATSVETSTNKMEQAAKRAGTNIEFATNHATATTAANVAKMVLSLQKTDQSDKSYKWGADTMNNYIRGITDRVPVLIAAVDAAALAVSLRLGHSIAKEGPLHNGGRGEIEWGEHMVDNLIRGMKNREEMLGQQAESMARVISGPLSSITVSPDWNASYATRRAAVAAANAGGDTYSVSIDGVTVNDTPAIQQAVLALVDAARVSAEARRRA